MSLWKLDALGRRPWAAVRQELAGCTCVWLDLDGLNLGEAPVEAPIATHLWGWADGRYVRVRLDDDHAYVGVLREPAAPEPPGEDVTVLVRSAVMRGSEHDEQHLKVELLEIPGSAPVTFVRPAR
ncbi:hypothetical protein [Goodfellowiella coeruleoviolacea]|uniref:Uncharacterized protein n=1 Tax=Goodfellowiella coeruleoviolacea TaxID=334858 RepID=A0AAE3GMT0_9PSEU|nr:hypothetical protein [Goodfellowiella coeruleoviolacea]MCP2170352.1 hypothetical protein [Goodfellowiella coeruleoviolacea]